MVTELAEGALIIAPLFLGFIVHLALRPAATEVTHFMCSTRSM